MVPVCLTCATLLLCIDFEWVLCKERATPISGSPLACISIGSSRAYQPPAVSLLAPQRAHSGPAIMMDDDDDEWQEMPVIQSTNKVNKLEIERQWRLAREENGEDPDEPAEGEEDLSDASSSDDGTGRKAVGRRRRLKNNKAGLRIRHRPLAVGPSTSSPTTIPKLGPPSATGSQKFSPLTPRAPTAGNATGNLIDFDDEGSEWREKGKVDEQDYTRLELDEDPEEDEVHTRTQYLFDDDKGMTPLSQMQTTKTMLSDPQRIAYVGLCRLVTREMATVFKGLKELQPATESMQNWGTKVMGRLYQHMEIDPAGERPISVVIEQTDQLLTDRRVLSQSNA